MKAQCPSGVVIGGPAATIVGDGGPAVPVDRARSRRRTTVQSRSPRSRTVVTPAASWRPRESSMTSSSRAASSVAIRSRAPSWLSAPRWQCMSTRPGSSVAPGKSRTCQPSGAGARPGSVPVIRPSSTNTVSPPGSGRTPSKARSARITWRVGCMEPPAESVPVSVATAVPVQKGRHGRTRGGRAGGIPRRGLGERCAVTPPASLPPG